ncbi:MAG: hypothetical protein E7213_05130 [Clostridium sp.]|nr:hypothetical protein [Clostridium sp.]
MKGKMIIKLLNKDEKKLYVEIESKYRKYAGYLCSQHDDSRLNIGRHRIDFEKLIREDKQLIKNVCIKGNDSIDLNYNIDNRNLRLHLDKVYEGHYCGFGM